MIIPLWLPIAAAVILTATVAVLVSERRARDRRRLRAATLQRVWKDHQAAQTRKRISRQVRLPVLPPVTELLPLAIPPGEREPLEPKMYPPISDLDPGHAYMEWLHQQTDGSQPPAVPPVTESNGKIFIDDDNGATELKIRMAREQQAGLPVEHEHAPGSKMARGDGCTCDRKINCNGRGYQNENGHMLKKDGKPYFVYTTGCPLHWPHARHQHYLELVANETNVVDELLNVQIAKPAKRGRDPRKVFGPLLKK